MLRPSAVLFLDLLGTSAERTEEEAKEHLLATHRALANARHYGGSERWDQHMSISSWFSDNLGLAFPLQSGLDFPATVGLTVVAAAAHQLSLALDGMFARGAIAFGSFYADPDFIEGPALNRAVALEKDAGWPRVTLDEDSAALAMYGLLEQEFAGASAAWRSSLMVDEDEVVFVNYLDSIELFVEEIDRGREALRLHRDAVRRNLDGRHPAKIHDKYRALATYHDDFLSGLRQEYVEDLYVEPAERLGGFKPFAHDVPIPPEPADAFE
ncbi:MAG: hypothetical protein QM729_07355 [Solirubrobacterales bacterium]